MAKRMAAGKKAKGKRMADGGTVSSKDMYFTRPGVDSSSIGKPSIGRGEPFLGRPGVDGPAIGKPSIGRGKPFLGRPGVDSPSTMPKKPGIRRPAPIKGVPTNEIPFTRPGVDGPASMPGKPAPVKPGPSLTRPGVDQPNNNMMFTRPGVDSGKPLGGMRGGGLARKGKGQALAKGGAVKPRGFGCAVRGMKKTKGK